MDIGESQDSLKPEKHHPCTALGLGDPRVENLYASAIAQPLASTKPITEPQLTP